MYAYHQPGPTRTRQMQTGRFQPYGMSRTRRNEYRNAQAGPSTLPLLPVPSVGPPTLSPSGGYISETTANAEKKQTFTEEDKVAVSNFYCAHIPRVTGCSFGVRLPSRPGFPEAKDHLAPTGSGQGRPSPRYATGSSDGRGTGNPPLPTWL